MYRKKVLVWETLATVAGGQKMTLTVLDMLSDQYEFLCLIPTEGMLSEELKKRNISYVLMGDQALPTGVKGKQAIFRYGWMSMKSIWKSLSIIRNYEPDILYCPGPAALPWSAVCGSLMQKPVIWHLHHIFLDGTTKSLLNLCAKWKSVKKIIAISNCVGNQMQNNTAHQKVKELYNPVDFERYSNGNAVNIRMEIEDTIGFALDKSRIIIGHVALVQRSKRQDFVLDVIAGLKQKNLKPVGIFAGETRESKYLDEIKEKAKNLGIYSQVVFLGRRNDIPDLLKLIDVLVIPSIEGFTLAGLEAASAGVPVVACNVAGAEEFIRVSGNGKCYTDNNVDEAISAVQSCVKNRNNFEGKAISFAKKCSVEQYCIQIKKCFSV